MTHSFIPFRPGMIPLRPVIFFILFALAASVNASASNDSIYIHGRLKESLGKTDLTDGWAVMLDKEGNPKDSVRTNRGKRYRDGEILDLSDYGFRVPRKDSVYYIQLSCPRYTPKTIAFKVKDVARERNREIFRWSISIARLANLTN